MDSTQTTFEPPACLQHRVVHAQAQTCITDDVYVVRFKDGSTVALHTVLQTGVPSMFQRAAATGPGRWQRFDLRHAAPVLAQDLPITPGRDVPGVVAMTLRLAYATGADLLDAIVAPSWVATPDNNEMQQEAA